MHENSCIELHDLHAGDERPNHPQLNAHSAAHIVEVHYSMHEAIKEDKYPNKLRFHGHHSAHCNRRSKMMEAMQHANWLPLKHYK